MSEKRLSFWDTQFCLSLMDAFSERIPPLQTCANPKAPNQNVCQANVYENEMAQTNGDVNCSGASPTVSLRGRVKGS